ncbi:hypothetical protein [Actinoplanes sp. N902-109]|uniref:hypothetical protein n=1 Tax=Actinoplanes sp. (strain N902-109) TaxID=649831 RepID=UPI0003294D06|nr:hypothetical protein [Actinoplanes sp. N902-109]AGL20873.1 hypothetical protein L083_7363 [Actinoplanes sp. N902-109]
MGDGINVETGGLTNFSKEVHADTDVFLGPATDRAEVQFREGIRFGVNNESDAVLAAKTRYADSLTAHQQNLREYVSAARLLANAADKVATMMQQTDSSAATSTQAAEQALWAAAEEARRIREAAVHGAQAGADPHPLGGQAVPQ